MLGTQGCFHSIPNYMLYPMYKYIDYFIKVQIQNYSNVEEASKIKIKQKKSS